MSLKTPSTKARRKATPIKLYDYYTDGTRLVMVVAFKKGASVMVEDVVTEQEFLVKPKDFTKYRSVKLKELPLAS